MYMPDARRDVRTGRARAISIPSPRSGNRSRRTILEAPPVPAGPVSVLATALFDGAAPRKGLKGVGEHASRHPTSWLRLCGSLALRYAARALERLSFQAPPRNTRRFVDGQPHRPRPASAL